MEKFDAVVVGAGHAGCEAALALARMGHETLLLTLNLDALALMPCNPAVGGTGKGHLVREVDALGGEMGRCIDDTFIQSRMLNTGKGPAVHSLRAQADKLAYRLRMRRAVDDCERLQTRQAEVKRIFTQGGRVRGRVFEKPHHHRRMLALRRAAGAAVRKRADRLPARSGLSHTPL